MPRTPEKGRFDRDGFTLGEVMTAFALMSLVVIVVVPWLGPGDGQADSAVREMASSLTSAQRIATVRQHDVVVTFLTSARRLRLLQDRNNNGAIDPGEDVRIVELPETIGFGRGSAPPLGGDAGAVSFEIENGAPTLVFHRNGSASQSGHVYVRPIEGSEALDVGAVRALSVERATGIVQCFSYRTTEWVASC